MEKTNNDDEWETISVKRRTKGRLRALGNFGEGWDDLLNRLANIGEEQRMDELTNVKEK
jgi:hypothetical protein